MVTLTQLWILIAVDILKDSSHGNNVESLLVRYAGRRRSSGIYVTLHRLRDKGLLDQWVGGTNSPRPFYSLTRRGAASISQVFAALDNLKRLDPSNEQASHRQSQRHRARHAPADAPASRAPRS